MEPEAERRVERAGRLRGAVDDCLPATFFVQAAQGERADRGAEPAAAELIAGTDRLELADGVLVVGPAETVGGEAAAGSLDDAVERFTVRPLGADGRVARLGEP